MAILRRRILVLNVKRQWFDDIRSGVKKEEYRLVKPFWDSRLAKDYSQICIRLGYASADDPDRNLYFPWRGVTVRKITHPEFGPDPVDVYVIPLE